MSVMSRLFPRAYVLLVITPCLLLESLAAAPAPFGRQSVQARRGIHAHFLAQALSLQPVAQPAKTAAGRNLSVLVFVAAAALLTVYSANLSGQNRVSERELKSRIQSYSSPAPNNLERAKRGADFVEVLKVEQNRTQLAKILDQEKDPAEKESLIRFAANTLGSAEVSSYDRAAVHSVILILLERTKSGQAALLLADKLFSLTISEAFALSTDESDALAGELYLEIEKATSGDVGEKAMTILAQDALEARNENRDLFLNVTRFTETISALARTMAQREPVVFAPAKRDPGQDSRAALARNRLVRAVVAEALLTAVLLGLGILAVIQPAMIKRILSKFSRTSGRFFWWRC